MPAEKVTDDNAVHELNGPVVVNAEEDPIRNIFFPIVTERSPTQPVNALSNMLVILVEITMFPEQHAFDGCVLLTQS